MSWLDDFTNPDGPLSEQKDKKFVDDGPKVKDASGKMVSTKTANQPFLKHKEWREKEAARKAAKAQRKKERAEKLARGEEVGPEEPDEEQEIGLMSLLKFFLGVIVVALLASKFVTGDWFWGYRGKWTNIHTYLPKSERLFTEETLAKFDGSNPDLPVYIAIDSTVYDVTLGKRIYGKGGSYNHMAGHDSTRAYGTGCFQTHRTHDLRGVTEAEMKGIQHWIQFFAEHPTYHKIGKVIHPPIDLSKPPPPHCNPPPPDTAEAPEPTEAPGVEHGEL